MIAFRLEVEPGFPEFYRYKRENWKRMGVDPDRRLSEILEYFPKIEEKFNAKTEIIERDIQESAALFQKNFDDFNLGFDIHIMHSLGEMDGGSRTIEGKQYFIFGVDSIARFHDFPNDKPFFAHEFLHFYQAQFFSGPEMIWTALWTEGLATYISEVLNPGASPAEILLDFPKGMIADCDKILPELWRRIDSLLTSSSEEEYEKFFLLSSKDPQVPRRAGYYLGYLVAKQFHAGESLKDLAKLQGPILLARIRAAIEVLKGRGK